jgi:hypothetical protein
LALQLQCLQLWLSHSALRPQSHRLEVQSTRASLGVRLWSSQRLVKNGDIRVSLGADHVGKRMSAELPVDWDAILVL